VPAEQFQLWHNGKEVPLFITASAGILSPTDYIEFWGQMNDGKTDKALYRDSSYQMSDFYSLETDSATYFLTVNTSGNNKRYVSATNDVAHAAIQPEKNFMYDTLRWFRGSMNPGFGVMDTKPLYLSSYDKGECWTSRPIRANCDQQVGLGQNFPTLKADTTGAPITVNINLVGNALYARDVKIMLNNDSLTQVNLDYFTTLKLQIPNIPANKIQSDALNFYFNNLSQAGCDEFRVAGMIVNYPRKFDFNNSNFFKFDIAASDTGRFLKIINFNSNGAAPVLYDATNGKRYVSDVSVPGLYQFLLQPSSGNYHLSLARGDGSNAQTITRLEARHFIDFTQAANQGDFIIISNPLIYGSGATNYVEQYRAYRSSDSGGNFNAKVYDIHELEDQFAYGIVMHPLSVKNFLRFARNNFLTKPKYTFIIGKGVTYDMYRGYSNTPTESNYVYKLNLVPTFGSPGSDNLLVSDNYEAVPTTPVGRLSAVSPQEVGDYLTKVKEYEKNLNDTTKTTLTDRLWMKKVLQLTGADDATLGPILDSINNRYKKNYKRYTFWCRCNYLQRNLRQLPAKSCQL